MTKEERPTIKTAELGYNFTREELCQQCKAIYGAVAWPGKRPGFAVVIGMGHDKKMYLLEEYESESVLDLVRKCGALNFKYRPADWYGDRKNTAADRFMEEMNEETKDRDQFSLSWSPMLDKEGNLCQYMLDKLRGVYLKTDEKRLFLKESRVINYISGIEPSQISAMEPGEYPAIEAVAIAAIELQNDADQKANQWRDAAPDDDYDPLSLGNL